MIVYRLCREAFAKAPLDGEGARLYGGRWNPKGVRMVYCATSIALSALESFVHFSSALLPADYVSIAMGVSDRITIETWTASDLPPDWAHTPAPSALQELGREWIASGRTAVLRVPSAVIATDFNILINPDHADAKKIRVRKPERFVFDPRLIKTPTSVRPRRRRK